jgi:mono/diheme cytochrome c family protein
MLPHTAPRHSLALAALLAAASLAGCTQQMANQPKYLPQAPSSFFNDGRAARPLVEGTVARGSLIDESLEIAPNSNTFPIPVTPELLARGQERFNIFCAECHGALGDGNGIIADRGVRHPPSYHIDRLRQAPVGHFYDVITNGFGIMNDYAAQVPPRDRLAIIAYIRALQLSQSVPAAALSPAQREKLASASPAQPSHQAPAEKP